MSYVSKFWLNKFCLITTSQVKKIPAGHFHTHTHTRAFVHAHTYAHMHALAQSLSLSGRISFQSQNNFHKPQQLIIITPVLFPSHKIDGAMSPGQAREIYGFGGEHQVISPRSHLIHLQNTGAPRVSAGNRYNSFTPLRAKRLPLESAWCTSVRETRQTCKCTPG